MKVTFYIQSTNKSNESNYHSSVILSIIPRIGEQVLLNMVAYTVVNVIHDINLNRIDIIVD